MKYLIDKFGSDFETVVVDDEHFKATVSVCTSTTFYSWVFGFNGKIKVEGPQHVVEAYKEMLVNALGKMSFSLLPKILRTCVPLNNSPLASRSKGYYNTVNGTIHSVIERKELKP